MQIVFPPSPLQTAFYGGHYYMLLLFEATMYPNIHSRLNFRLKTDSSMVCFSLRKLRNWRSDSWYPHNGIFHIKICICSFMLILKLWWSLKVNVPFTTFFKIRIFRFSKKFMSAIDWQSPGIFACILLC